MPAISRSFLLDAARRNPSTWPCTNPAMHSRKGSSPAASNGRTAPAIAILRMILMRLSRESAAGRRVHEPIQFFRISDPHICRIPLDPFTGKALRDASEQECLGDRCLYLEVCQRRRRPALARGYELVDGRIAGTFPARLPRRRLILLRFGVDARIVPIEARQDDPLIAHVQDALVVLAGLEEVLILRAQAARTLGPQSAVVPGHAHRGTVAHRGVVQVDDGCFGVAFVKRLAGAGLHRHRRRETQDLEYAREAVAAHVAERAAAEVVPAPPDKRQIRVIEWTLRRGTQPQVPIETVGDRLR